MNVENTSQMTSEQNLRSKKIVTDFGVRTFYRTANSPAICLPKIAVDNCHMLDTKKVRVLLVDEENERYIKLVPISNENGGETS
jgi:hypothetical protein